MIFADAAKGKGRPVIKKLIAGAAAALLTVTMACAAPMDGQRVTVATVDYDEMYWDPGINYTRVIELQHSGENNGTLIATYELATSGLHIAKPGYNIHISRDGGSTWDYVTTVREKAAAVQSEWQPFLFELPCAIGDMPEGTLILAACSVDASHARQTALRLYRSSDIGQTWEQYGTIATGGGEKTGVWEPFLMLLPDGRLACYYSDCTDRENHSQKLVMKISEDGVTWGDVIDIVSLEDRQLRPGMATVVQMNDGRYIMAYEMCHEADPNYGNPIYYRYSADGINWGDPKDPGLKVVTNTGAMPGSSPYLAYVPSYGENGLLLMTACFQRPGQLEDNLLYVNDDLGDPDAWRTWTLPDSRDREKGGYSHALFIAADEQTLYFVNNVPDPDSEQGFTKMIFIRYRFEDGALNK